MIPDSYRLHHRAVAAVILLAVVLLGLALLLAPAGCHPQLPPVSGCAPHVYACHDGAPVVCSASHRWEPAGDIACPGACVVNDAGVAYCGAAVDGGIDAR